MNKLYKICIAILIGCCGKAYSKTTFSPMQGREQQHTWGQLVAGEVYVNARTFGAILDYISSRGRAPSIAEIVLLKAELRNRTFHRILDRDIVPVRK
jgi:hypothetical protein